MSKQFSEAGGIPVSKLSPISSFSPVVLPVPGRAADLHVKVSAPERTTETSNFRSFRVPPGQAGLR
ncbi:hypothetical protein [Streptomyces sp. MBT62]|uniref:hypothetical protein n=1 Tax=Streptomyces sp. MBT62 TaxID=2800410 RepID=UPI00190D6917|nr:hypothetical protein [Streptomyces sp. MBT62]MBK3567989.1 hypothetical protein [Streptomyces sp. MBT62]